MSLRVFYVKLKDDSIEEILSDEVRVGDDGTALIRSHDDKYATYLPPGEWKRIDMEPVRE